MRTYIYWAFNKAETYLYHWYSDGTCSRQFIRRWGGMACYDKSEPTDATWNETDFHPRHYPIACNYPKRQEA